MFESIMAWGVEMTTSLTNWINDISDGNQFMAGVILTGIMALAVRVKFVVLGKIPEKIFRRFTVNAYMDYVEKNPAVQNRLLSRLNEHVTDGGSRSFKIRSENRRDTSISGIGQYIKGYYRVPGLGKHRFFLDGKLYWYSIVDLPSDGVVEVKSRITISTFGSDHHSIDKLLRTMDVSMGDNEIEVLSLRHNVRTGGMDISRRPISVPALSELALDDVVSNNLKKVVSEFFNREDLYTKTPMTHKFTLLLHGEPGSGKTSTLISLAREMGYKEVISIPISKCSSIYDIERLVMKNADEYKFLIIEDIHSNINLSKSRTEGTNSKVGIDLSDMLNFLNGIIPLEKTFCVMTTNYIEDLEPALLRPGRVDMVAELPRISPDVSNEYISRYIPDWNSASGFRGDVRGCDISQVFGCSKMEIARVHQNILRIEKGIPEKPIYKYIDSNIIDLSIPT